MSEQTVIAIVKALIDAAPDALDWIERLVKGERAKRVEEVRTSPTHTDAAIDELKRGS